MECCLKAMEIYTNIPPCALAGVKPPVGARTDDVPQANLYDSAILRQSAMPTGIALFYVYITEC